MGLFRAYLRHVGSGLKPYTKDDARRDFQKRQWRKRVDAQMAAARKGQHQYFVCAQGHHHKVYARAVECDQRTMRAQQAASGHTPANSGVGAQAPAEAADDLSFTAQTARHGHFVGFTVREIGNAEAGIDEVPCCVRCGSDGMMTLDIGDTTRLVARLDVLQDAIAQAGQESVLDLPARGAQ